MKKALYVATVVKTHIMHFHVPYLKMLKEMGWETSVAARNDYENPADCAIPYCDHYYDIPFERSPLKHDNLKAYKALKRLIDAGEYDIIHCHTPVGAMLTRLAAIGARKRGTRVIYTAHGFHFFKGAPLVNWLLYYPVERILAHWTDVLITINKEDYARAQTFKAKKVCYVPGVGIDTKKFAPNPEIRDRKRQEFCFKNDEIVLLSVGELIPRKNHKVVIEALALLNRKDVKYIICGSGPLMEAYHQLAESLGVADQVILAGYRRDVADIYQAADIFVFPSLQEGLPVAMMEAMASDLPVVCSRIRGNVDLVECGKTGLSFTNSVEDLTAALQKTIVSIQLREKFKAEARKQVETYSLPSIIKAMEKLYAEVLEVQYD